MPNILKETLRLYRDSYSGHPKNIWVLTIVSFINRLGTMVVLFMGVYLTTILNFNLEETGFILTSFGIGSFLGALMGGFLSDKIGERYVILMSLFLGGIFLILIQWASTFWELFGVILATTTFGEAYRPALMSLVGKTVPKHETSRSMALIRLAINLGFSAAPIIGGFVAVSIGYGYIFWIDGLTCISAAIFFLFASASWKSTQEIKEPQEIQKINAETISPFKNSNFLSIVFMNLFVAICFIQWFNAIPVFIKTEWLFDERFLGLIMTVNAILIFLFELPVIHYLTKKRKIRQAMQVGLCLMALSFIPFLFSGALIWAFLAITLMTMGEILLFPFISSSAINMSTEGNRGKYMSIYSMSWSITRIFAPAGLALIAVIGYRPFWLILVSFSLIGLLLFSRIKKEVFDKHNEKVL